MTINTTRERLLEAASRLFYADGISATGINAITDAAGVAKMSLYNNFPSKNELAMAYLEERHAEWLALYDRRVAEKSAPADRVLAVFEAYIDHAECAYEHGFRGCGLLNAAAEFPARSEGRDLVRKHKEQVEQILFGHLAELTDEMAARHTAEHLSFLLEGAMSRAGLEGDSTRLQRAKSVAASILGAL